eukprot:TRINITY_DN14781_c0_g1_i4.p1 TRINITY_DN14781_c0_g1~~TRINITY_DN14781_c0_g1_i4.p1  ORF type:complete len:138 (-),score=27.74 TRINITY_DN14781_c0_g1_i4:498-881(-)
MAEDAPTETEAPKKVFDIFKPKAGRKRPAETSEAEGSPNLKGTEKTQSDLQQSLIDSISESSWRELLHAELHSANFASICRFLESENQAKRKVFPAQEQIFAAFNATPLDNLKVVILGQGTCHFPKG